MALRDLGAVAADHREWAGTASARLPLGFSAFDSRSGGVAPGELLLFLARPQVGKCVTGDMRVLLADGSYVPIAKLTGDHEVITTDGHTFMPAAAKWIPTGWKETVTMETKLGRRITTTPEHPYLTPQGWRPVEELHVGETIAVPGRLPHGAVSVPDYQAGLLGLWLADGTGKSTSPQVTSNKYGAEIARWAKEFGCQAIDQTHGDRATTWALVSYRRGEGWKPNPIHQWLEELGLRGCQAGDKHVPDAVFTWDEESVAYFLHWYFSGDGWLSKSKGSNGQLGMSSKSERLVRDISHLLLRFGVTGRVSRRRHANGMDYWYWDTRRAGSIQRFLDRIGIDRPLAETWEAPAGAREPLGDVIYDKIVSITPGPVREVFDLTVAEHHAFVCEDVIAHNTVWACNVLARIRSRQIPCVFFSLEMDAKFIAQRLAAITYQTTTHGIETETAVHGRSAVMDTLQRDYPKLLIEDDPTMTLRRMRNVMEEAAERFGQAVRLVFVDFLELIRASGAMEPSGHVEKLSQGLKVLARETDTTVIALHQVPRGEKNAGDQPLSLISGRFGGETMADYVLAAYRPCLRHGIEQDEYEALQEQWFLQYLKTRSGGDIHPGGVMHQLDRNTMTLRELV